MKNIVLLFLLELCAHNPLHAQCPTKTADFSGNGTRHDLTLTNISQCPTLGTVIPVGTNTTDYISGYCGNYGDPTGAVVLEVVHNNGALIALSTQTSGFTIVFSGNSCIYNNAGNPIALPIELIEFKGTPSVSGNVLTWTTASEVSNRGFQVERLVADKAWLPLTFVKSKGASGQYSFTDYNPLPTSYYRLLQLDNDGKETLSKVVSVERQDALNRAAIKIYPNPVSSLLTIETTDGLSFQILNLLGQQVLAGKKPPLGVGGIDVSALPQGTYILKVGAEQAKFLKQ